MANPVEVTGTPTPCLPYRDLAVPFQNAYTACLPKCFGPISGYNLKRKEFDPEYDQDAEQIIADLEFHENDSEGGP